MSDTSPTWMPLYTLHQCVYKSIPNDTTNTFEYLCIHIYVYICMLYSWTTGNKIFEKMSHVGSLCILIDTYLGHRQTAGPIHNYWKSLSVLLFIYLFFCASVCVCVYYYYYFFFPDFDNEFFFVVDPVIWLIGWVLKKLVCSTSSLVLGQFLLKFISRQAHSFIVPSSSNCRKLAYEMLLLKIMSSQLLVFC